MGRHIHHRGWRRRAAVIDPAVVLAELRRRQFENLEDCRIAWEQALDPLALCAALAHVDDMPEWLADGLLTLLTDGDSNDARFLRDRWRARRQHAIDGARAAALAFARVKSAESLATCAIAANKVLTAHYGDVPHVNPDAVRKSYSRVAVALANAGRYYLAPKTFRQRLRGALARVETIRRKTTAQMSEPTAR